MADGRVYATLAPAHKTPVKFRHNVPYQEGGHTHVRMMRFDGEPGQTYEIDAAEFAVLEKRGIVVAAKAPQPATRNPQPDKE